MCVYLNLFYLIFGRMYKRFDGSYFWVDGTLNFLLWLCVIFILKIYF